MKGTALSVNEKITIIDNTHEINPFDIWEGGYRLYQSDSYIYYYVVNKL